jgi:hypothetical protein
MIPVDDGHKIESFIAQTSEHTWRQREEPEAFFIWRKVTPTSFERVWLQPPSAGTVVRPGVLIRLNATEYGTAIGVVYVEWAEDPKSPTVRFFEVGVPAIDLH